MTEQVTITPLGGRDTNGDLIAGAGNTTTGLPAHTARHSGLPGFSATPWAMIPGAPSRPTSL